MPVDRLLRHHGRRGRHAEAGEIAEQRGDHHAAGRDLDRNPSGEDRSGENGDVGPRFDQPGAGEHFVLVQVLRQDRVLDRAEEGRVHAHSEKSQEHQRNGQRRGQIADPGEHKPDAADRHNADLRQLDPTDDHCLVAHVGQLPRQGREDEERQDEQPRSDRRKLRLGLLGVVHAVNDEQHHRVLVEVVVERVEQLGGEQRQEAALVKQISRCQHASPSAVSSRNCARP